MIYAHGVCGCYLLYIRPLHPAERLPSRHSIPPPDQLHSCDCLLALLVIGCSGLCCFASEPWCGLNASHCLYHQHVWMCICKLCKLHMKTLPVHVYMYDW